MSRTPDAERPDGDAALDAYIDGWKQLNASMRRGEPWSGGERNAAFLNLGSPATRMVDVAPVVGLDAADDGRSAARIDIDFDGDDDLVVTNRTAPRVRVYANRLADGANSIAVRVAGTRSNREGIGAVVYATPVTSVDEASDDLVVPGMTQRRSRTVGAGYLAQSSAWLRFGLPRAAADGGRRARAPRVHLRVRWPGPDGGTIEDFGVVRANRRYVLTEGAGVARESVASARVELEPGSLELKEPLLADGRRRLVLPAATSIPSVEVLARDGRAARLFGITPAGPRGAGQPTVVIVWNSAEPNAVEAIGDVAALVDEARAGDALLVAIDLGTDGSGLSAAGWTGSLLAATQESARLLPELVGWRLDRTEPPPGPWSFVVEADGRLAVVRTGPWRSGDLAADLKLLAVPAPLRPSVSTPYPGVWAEPPGDADLTRLRARLVRIGVDAPVRELDLARVRTTRPDDPDVQVRLGRAMLQQGDLERALGRFDAAIAADETYVLARRARAYTLHLLGRFDEATVEWTLALDLDPSDLETLGNRALAAVAAGDLERARDDLSTLRKSAEGEVGVVEAVERALREAERDSDR
ncbi:MAG: ASPIC/UnbV domain-containing protein [Planctomycetota bacterium]